MPKNDFWADVDTRSLMLALKMLGKDTLPDTIAETLNRTADAVTRQSLRNVNKELIVRTKYTTNSLKSKRATPYYALNKAKGRSIHRMFSRAGTISPYLGIQETGGTTTGAGGGPLPIPDEKIRTNKSLQRAIQKKYRISEEEKLRPGAWGRQTGARYFIGIPKGSRFRTYGLYERGYNNKRLQLLRNLEHEQATIPATHWFTNAVRKYGTPQFIKAQFERAARRRLSKFQGRK